MKKYIALLVTSQLCALTSAYAVNLPADMMFEEKPIDSLCFDTYDDSHSKTIDLKSCGIKNAHYINKGLSTELSNQGFFGYDWQAADGSFEGYSYYKFFAAKNNTYWIYSINNGGGTGSFTDISLVRRKDANTLAILKDIATGDRCNGGIDEASAKNHVLTFTVNLTSYDLIQLADKKLSGIKAYDDLAACATCCSAKAVYTIQAGHSEPTLKHVEIGGTKAEDFSEQGKYAACFNNLLAAASKNKQMNQKDINAFAEKFKQTCVQ